MTTWRDLLQWIVTVGGVLLLVAVVVLQFSTTKRRTEPSSEVGLEALPAMLSGWTVTDQPIGETESLNRRSQRILKYDKYVYRVYQKGTLSFSVYVAYWRPGKAAPDLVANHTPDHCWTLNGWVCSAMKSRVSLHGMSRMLHPSEWREFIPPYSSRIVSVWFWHIVGGKPNDMIARFNDKDIVPNRWRNHVDNLLGKSEEQYFVRISSESKYLELENEPGFRQVLDALGRMALYSRQQG